jgi:release factor glutamine methyltransferase
MYEPQEDSYLLQEAVLAFAEKHKINTALDMGTGTGIQGLSLVGRAGKIILGDVNEEEIKKLKEKTGKEKEIESYTGDLFENIPEKYKNKISLIIFNPPYLPREADEEDDPELTSGKSGIETTKRFLEQAKAFLAPEGTIFFAASSLARIDELEKFMRQHRYDFSVDRKKHISFEDIIIYRAWRK